MTGCCLLEKMEEADYQKTGSVMTGFRSQSIALIEECHHTVGK